MTNIPTSRRRVHRETQRERRRRLILEYLHSRRGSVVFEPGNSNYRELADQGIPEHAVDRHLEWLEADCEIRISRGVEPKRWHVELLIDARVRD